MNVRFTSELDPAAYRRMLVTLAVFRLRIVAPILTFFTFGALAAGRTSEAAFLGMSLVGMGLIIWLWASWQAHSPANTSIYVKVQYTIGDSSVAFESGEDSGEIPWHAIKRWRYMAGHYLLHVSSGTFIAIPSASVPEEDRAALESLFAEKISKGPRGTVR